MELQEFITNTLVAITKGVEDANQVSNRFQISGQIHHGKGINGDSVEFDVGLEVNESDQKSGKAGIDVSVIELGGDIKTAKSNQNTHRLKFRVFITEK